LADVRAGCTAGLSAAAAAAAAPFTPFALLFAEEKSGTR
jgi:hypothetical protein